jgi:hypothetical protein
MALSGGSLSGGFASAFGGVAEVHGWRASTAFDANDPIRSSRGAKSRTAATPDLMLANQLSCRPD